MRILILFVLFSGTCSAQHSGFYGKKNYIEFDIIGSVPLIDNLFFYDATGYKPSGSNLVSGKDWFESGLRLALGHSVSNKFGIGIEFGMDFQNVAPNLFGSNFDYNADYILKHEMLDLRTIVVVPKVEFTSADGLLPIGLNHQIGLGYTSTTVLDRKYVLDRNGTIAPTGSLKLSPISEGFTGMVLFYALNMRTALSKHFMLNYGIRYSANFLFVSNESLLVIAGYQVSRQNIGRGIRNRRLHNVLSFNFGFSVPF
ncbi:MAG: hypothetical protein ACI865_002262 [Flavobacteriaceae bacterium]|jgi:hypothetical protein